MAKSGNNVHGTLRKREARAFGTKSFFVEEFVKREGYELVTEREGVWRNYYAVKGDQKLHIDTCAKGERFDGKFACQQFCVHALGWSYERFCAESAQWA